MPIGCQTICRSFEREIVRPQNVKQMANIRYVGNAGGGNQATKKELEGERQAGAFSIEDILGGCRKNSGRREFLPAPSSPFLPPPLSVRLPLFHSLPPIFPFLPFAYSSETRRPSPPAQKKVGYFQNKYVLTTIKFFLYYPCTADHT